jgi:hypothetical protein
MSSSILASEPVVLTSWKDIARYMGKGVRTVQRWERELDLPVRRPRGAASKSAVMANREDLDFWLASGWSRRRTDKQRAQAATAALTVAIREARELRAANHALMGEVSTAVRALIHSCDAMRRDEATRRGHSQNPPRS